MKKVMLLLMFCITISGAFAQIQRKVVDTNNVRKTEKSDLGNDEASISKKKDQLKLVKELNLTREQKGKLREMRQENEAKRVAITNDASLTETQKQDQLKAVKRSGAVGLQGILNDTQKKKMKEVLKERKGGKGEAMMIEESNL
jgi:hypothetical protein